MTKSLTEQWKDGELESGHYYIRSGWSKYIDIEYLGNGFFEGNIEVISAVPSYDEWQESQRKRALWFDEKARVKNRLETKIKLLEEQLNYALETMGQVAKLSDNMVDSVQCAHAICLINERLKEMEGVK